MNKQVQVTYTNIKGESLILGKFPPFRLLNYSGFGALENDIKSEKMYAVDGERKISSSLEVRDIELEILLQAKDFEEERLLKKTLISTMNPKLTGTIEYKVLNEVYEVDVEIVKGFNPSYKKDTVQFKALDPFWKDTSTLENTVSLGQTINMFNFPFEIIPEFQFASIESGKVVEINNPGHAPVGFELLIECTGKVVNPSLLNIYTEKHFTFKHTFEFSDRIYINTKRGQKKVLVNDENGMSLRKLPATFLQLDNETTNYLILQAESGVENMKAEIKFYPVLVGV
nr:MAG TPA: tail protein [Caudoviricetes sp.]